MEGVGWIGGGDGVADGGGLIAIDAVVFGSRDGESLGDRPGGVVKAHRGWRERSLGGVTRRESDGDDAVGWAREDEGLGISSAFVDGDDLHRSRGAQSGGVEPFGVLLPPPQVPWASQLSVLGKSTS